MSYDKSEVAMLKDAPLRWAGLLVAAISPLARQTSSLVTNRDGEWLYFAAPLVQRGSDQTNEPKIFRWSDEGVRLVHQIPLPPCKRRQSVAFGVNTPVRAGIHAATATNFNDGGG